LANQFCHSFYQKNSGTEPLSRENVSRETFLFLTGCDFFVAGVATPCTLFTPTKPAGIRQKSPPFHNKKRNSLHASRKSDITISFQ
jgi:hypothetical protein